MSNPPALADIAHQVVGSERTARTTGGNLARWRAAHARRSSNAATRHRDRYRDAARGVGKGGRNGAKAALRRGEQP